jgi:hypothetical protein
MREIKFRAWDKKVKVMQKPFSMMEFRDYGDMYSPKRHNIMQYTGLKDRHGKEIYEGDIIECADGTVVYEVLFEDGCFTAKSKIEVYKDPGSFDIIIGNIYENPELI